MLSKTLFRSSRALINARRCLFSELVKTDALADNIVAKEEPTFYELQEFQHGALKKYFDQDAMLFPIETIINKVGERDYRFFLQNKNFLKVVDTLEKFQSSVVNLDTQAGRDFVVFKRQLYQLYEVQNRSAEEHEAFSFQIERENLKWLYNAKQDFSKEMDRANALEDLNAHANLGGKIFKRKTMSPSKLTGLGYFGFAGFTYMYFPHMVMHFGQSMTMFGMSAASIMGMIKFQERDVVNSIEFIKEGEDAGKLKFSVSTSPFTSKNIVVSVSDCQAQLSLGNDDRGEDDIESNLVTLKNYKDGNELKSEGYFLLPADSWKDVNMLDWVLSVKNAGEDSTEGLFNDLMSEQFDLKAASGGMGYLAITIANAGYDRVGSEGAIDRLIEKDDKSVDSNLIAMTEFYGPKQVEEMSPTEFYSNYKKFASGITF